MAEGSTFFTINLEHWKNGKGETRITSKHTHERAFNVKVPLTGNRVIAIPLQRLEGAPAPILAGTRLEGRLPDIHPDMITIPEWDPVFITCLEPASGGVVVAIHGLPLTGESLLEDFESHQLRARYLELHPDMVPAE